MAYDAQYVPETQAWAGQQERYAASSLNTPTPKEPPLIAIGRGMDRVAEMVSRLENVADHLAGTRPEVVGGTMLGGVPSQNTVAHQLNNHANGLDSMATRMQSALNRIEQVFG